MLRILLLAPGSNPNGITGPLIGYSHGEALARLHAVTLVIGRGNEEAVRRKQSRFMPSRSLAFLGSIEYMPGASVGSLGIIIGARF